MYTNISTKKKKNYKNIDWSKKKNFKNIEEVLVWFGAGEKLIFAIWILNL